jgi:DNA-binding transcriptional MerR regulator
LLNSEKIYFSISVVAKICDLEVSIIRSWQKEFKQLNPKTTNKQRRYQRKDIDLIFKIKFFLYEKNLTIQETIQNLKIKDKKTIINKNLISEIKTEIKDILKLIKEK